MMAETEHKTIPVEEKKCIKCRERKAVYCVSCYESKGQVRIIQTLDAATDELADALSDFDAAISPTDQEAYDAMRRHVETAQQDLLSLLQKMKKNMYRFCVDCNMVFDFWKYDYDLESAGHDGHNVRMLTDQEFQEAVEKCRENGCFGETEGLGKIELDANEDPVKAGDTVMVVFWDGCFTYWYGKVQESEEGLFIDTEEGSVGFLQHAHEVRKAVEQKGWLLWASEWHNAGEGKWLIGVPLLREGGADWDNTGIIDRSVLDEEDVKRLEKIAENLGCELYTEDERRIPPFRTRISSLESLRDGGHQ